MIINREGSRLREGWRDDNQSRRIETARGQEGRNENAGGLRVSERVRNCDKKRQRDEIES